MTSRRIIVSSDLVAELIHGRAALPLTWRLLAWWRHSVLRRPMCQGEIGTMGGAMQFIETPRQALRTPDPRPEGSDK